MFDVILDSGNVYFDIKIDKDTTLQLALIDDSPLIDNRLGRQHRSDKELFIHKFDKNNIPVQIGIVKDFKQFAEVIASIAEQLDYEYKPKQEKKEIKKDVEIAE